MAITHLRSAHAVIVLCDACYSKITHETRMHCPSCILDLCINCFHKNLTKHPMHEYLLIEPLTFYVTDWQAIDDLLFCESLEIYGIGNWQDIAEFLDKSQDEIEQHFCKYYNVQPSKNNKKTIPALSNPNTHEIVSFMPNRGDFDTEIENDFETIFKELNMDSLSENLEEFRIELFDAFCLLQTRRAFYKYHIFEKNLINITILEEKENNYNDLEQRILQRIRPYSQFLCKNDFNKLFIGLCIEEMLRNKISECRRNIKTGFLELEKKRSLFLSDSEREICFFMHLSYKEYLKVKEIIIWDSLKTGYMDLKRAITVLGCNDKKLQIIVDFFKYNEWI